MKQILLFLCILFTGIAANAQKAVTGDLEVKTSLTLATKKVTGISNDTTGGSKNANALITEFAAKRYADSMKYTLPTATTTILGGIKIGADFSITSGVLNAHPNVVTGGSIPYLSSGGLFIEDNTGLSFDGNNLNVGHSGFSNFVGLLINGGRGAIYASGFGMTFNMSGGTPVDPSKHMRWQNSQYEYMHAFTTGTGYSTWKHYLDVYTNLRVRNLSVDSTAPTTRGTPKMVITDQDGQLSFQAIPAAGGSLPSGTGFVKSAGTTISFDNNNYATITQLGAKLDSSYKNKLALPLFITPADTTIHIDTVSLTTAGVLKPGYITKNNDTLATKADVRAAGGGGLTSANFVYNEVPSGTVNGSNTVFTLANTPVTGKIVFFQNGPALKLTTYWSISGNTITFVTAPATGAEIFCNYIK